MTNVDWAPLRDENPVPGDPFATQDLASHFAERAATVDDVIRGLERLDTGDLQSAAVEELRRLRDELIPDLRHLERRYDRTAGALRPYCDALERAQEMALDALQRAREAVADIRQARDGVEDMARHAEEQARIPIISAPGSPPPAPQPWAGPDWNAQLDDAEGRMAAAERLLQDAEDLYNQAGHNCANAINDAADDALQNEGGLFGAVGEFFEDAGDVIGGIAGWVADHFPTSLEDWSNVLGYISAGLGLLSMIFPVLAPAAALLGVIKLGIDTYLWATGRQGFGEVGMGLIGLATFGVGRVYTAAARGTAGAASQLNAQTLRATIGQRGALAGMVEFADDGTRYFGAAARSHRLKIFGDAVQEFGTDAATGLLPRGRHIVQAFSRWTLEGPSRDLVTRLGGATTVHVAARGADWFGFVQDVDQMTGEPLGDVVKQEIFGDKPNPTGGRSGGS